MKTANRKVLALLVLLFDNSTFAQTAWTKYAGNPVLTRSDASIGWDMFAAADPSVIKDGDTLKMWYSGGGIILPDTTARVRIGYAWSLDGLHWTTNPENPVLSPTSGGWDSLAIETVTVLKDPSAPVNERYRMWYGGSDDPIYGLYEIGYAFSPDGIHWTKHPANPVLSIGRGWESAGPEGPTIIKDGDTLKMWYAGYDTVLSSATFDRLNIGYAWTSDGVTWIKYADNPVLKTGSAGQWDARYIQDPYVLKIDNTYHLWYAGTKTNVNGEWQIGYALSSDGIHWTKANKNPVLKSGAPGSWDANTAAFPTVVWDGQVLHMWYTGIDTYPLPPWPAPFFWDIGYATAPLIVTAVSGPGHAVPKDFGLSQNYPNPFNPQTKIRFQLPTAGRVTLRIYNLLGEDARTLVNEKQSAGNYFVSWDGRNDAGR